MSVFPLSDCEIHTAWEVGSHILPFRCLINLFYSRTLAWVVKNPKKNPKEKRGDFLSALSEV